VTLAIELRKQGKEWRDIYPPCIPASVLYGQVAYCLPDDTAFRTGIEVYRVLLGGTDLSDILRAVLRQEMPTLEGTR
jgi:hypothetical protein